MHYAAMLAIVLLITTYNKEVYKVWNEILFTASIFYLAWVYLGL